jgi:hypothetical protein
MFISLNLTIIYLNSLASAKIQTNTIIIVAPEGTFILYESINPPTAPIKLIIIEIIIILLNFFEKRFAVVGGMVNREINRIIPTILMLNTIVNAINPFSRYVKVLTGIF